MATKKPKKPSLKKLPNKPKATDSLEAHKKYDKKAAEIEKENNKKISAYKKDLKAWQSVQKAKKKIREKY